MYLPSGENEAVEILLVWPWIDRFSGEFDEQGALSPALEYAGGLAVAVLSPLPDGSGFFELSVLLSVTGIIRHVLSPVSLCCVGEFAQRFTEETEAHIVICSLLLDEADLCALS